MRKHIKGIVQQVHNGKINTVNSNGEAYKRPWFSIWLKIGDQKYKLGYANEEFGPFVKEGDEVEFDCFEKESDDGGILNEILNDFKDPDKKTFHNITNPEKPKKGGGGWKADPQESARIMASAAVNSAIRYASSSHPEESTDMEAILEIAKKIENHIWGVNERIKGYNFANGKPNINPTEQPPMKDDEIPF